MHLTQILGILAILHVASSANADDLLQAFNLVNQARQAQGIAPLKWNSNLAAYAQYWANQLGSGNQPFSHGPPQLRPQQGENIYEYDANQCDSTFEAPFLTSMSDWLAEASQFTGQPIQTGQETWLHWSQCMWSDTTHIGCACAYSVSETCKFFGVCRFFPEGNILGRRPF